MSVDDPGREPVFTLPLESDPRAVLYVERLRDGRIALGTRLAREDGTWEVGELHLLSPRAGATLAGWLAPAVEETWSRTILERQADQLHTARDLYGEGAGAVERLAFETLREIPPALLARGLLLLSNAIGPEARERLVARLNRTPDPAEEAALRRQLAEEREALAYAVAAAALFDALARGLPEHEEGGSP